MVIAHVGSIGSVELCLAPANYPCRPRSRTPTSHPLAGCAVPMTNDHRGFTDHPRPARPTVTESRSAHETPADLQQRPPLAGSSPWTVPVAGRPCPGRPHDISGRSRTDRARGHRTDLIHPPVPIRSCQLSPGWLRGGASPRCCRWRRRLHRTRRLSHRRRRSGRRARSPDGRPHRGQGRLGPASGEPWTTR